MTNVLTNDMGKWVSINNIKSVKMYRVYPFETIVDVECDVFIGVQLNPMAKGIRVNLWAQQYSRPMTLWCELLDTAIPDCNFAMVKVNNKWQANNDEQQLVLKFHELCEFLKMQCEVATSYRHALISK